jgi:MoaA/NifB/PqqE/SkfB family radical SAM enzyme
MGIIKPFKTMMQDTAHLATCWKKLRREFRLFDYDYRCLDGYSFAPKSICLILTESCNLKCLMCDIGRKNERKQDNGFSPLTDAITRGEELMNMDDWKTLLDDIAGLNGHPLVLLTGTEPFLYPGILDLLDYGLSLNLNFHITTNGTLLSRFAYRLVELSTRRDSLRITISLDGIGEIHDAIRGVRGTFNRALEGIKALDDNKNKFKKRYPEITINYTISNHNHMHIRDFIEWFYQYESQLQGITFSHLWFKDGSIVDKHNRHFGALFPIQQENIADVDVAAIDMVNVHEQLHAVQQEKKRFRFYIAESPPLTGEEAKLYYRKPTETVFYNKCLAPWRNVAINPRGEVIISPLCFAGSMGNVKKDSFSGIWNGDNFRQFRRQLKKVGMYPACTRCCMLFDSKPKYYKIRQML